MGKSKLHVSCLNAFNSDSDMWFFIFVLGLFSFYVQGVNMFENENYIMSMDCF